MKSTFLLLLFIFLSTSFLTAQNLSINFHSSSSISYGLTTVENITFSNNNMNVNLFGGNTFSYNLDSIQYYKYEPTVTGNNNKIIYQSNDIKLFPNPSKDVIHLEFEIRNSSEGQITLYNITGQQIYHCTKSFERGKNKDTINLKTFNITTGVYFIEIKIGNSKYIEKLIYKN